LYAGNHTDRAYGLIDEVRISDTALRPDQFLFSTPWTNPPIVVRIKDLAYPNPPEIEVDGAPNGWNFCECGINTPGVEDGGIITLFGVDAYGSINEPCEGDWRFSDPNFPSPPNGCANGVDIVWIQHDFNGPFYQGDLQIAFDSAFPGHY